MKRTGEAFSHPFGPGLGFKPGGLDEEASVKRQKYEGNPAATGPVNQGLLQGGAVTKAESRAGSQGNLRSSALGQALLFGIQGKGGANGQVPVAVAGCEGQGAQGDLLSSSTSGLLSRLGEAVSAEDRLQLKRRRVCGDQGQVQPCSQGALDAIAACRDVEVASAVAAWPLGPREHAGRGGSSSSGPAGPC